ncbi:MAG: hypothetical protein RLZZ490_304 [Cyanobacteriota bacterium]
MFLGTRIDIYLCCVCLTLSVDITMKLSFSVDPLLLGVFEGVAVPQSVDLIIVLYLYFFTIISGALMKGIKKLRLKSYGEGTVFLMALSR